MNNDTPLGKEIDRLRNENYVLRMAIKEIRAMPFPVEPPNRMPQDRLIWDQWQRVVYLCDKAIQKR